ncbi:MAG: hydrolase [Streptosporangiales bacterium]|nr:hydrolase [Streptosporangiales bacterium]
MPRVAAAALVACATAFVPVAAGNASPPGGEDVDVIAHRGSSGVTPENTAVAIAKAIKQRADFVEIDVQRTKDGRLVNFHDCTMERTTDVEQRYPDRPSYRVSDFTWAELRTLDAGSWFDERYEGEPIITVRDVIRRVDRTKTGLLAEISPCGHYQGTGLPEDLVQELWSVPGYVDRALADGELGVQSFEPGDAKAFKDVMPEIPVGLLDAERPSDAELVELSAWADQVNTSTDVTDAALIARIQELGMTSNVWTVNEPGRMRQLIDMGVDGLITDFPQSLTQR